MHVAVAYIYAMPHPSSSQQRAHKDATPFEGGGNKSHWTTLDIAQTTAWSSISNNEVELNMQTLKKKFTFAIPDDVKYGHHLSQFSNPLTLQSTLTLAYPSEEWGYFIVKDVRQIEVCRTYFVDYNNTRVLIFESQGDISPVAVVSRFPLDFVRT